MIEKIKAFCKKMRVPAYAGLVVSASVLIAGGTTTQEIGSVIELVLGVIVGVGAIISIISAVTKDK